MRRKKKKLEPVHADTRQDAIKSILREALIHKQSQLVALLADQGIETSQVTVSRDFKELHVSLIWYKSKSGDWYQKYVLPEDIR